MTGTKICLHFFHPKMTTLKVLSGNRVNPPVPNPGQTPETSPPQVVMGVDLLTENGEWYFLAEKNEVETVTLEK